MPIEVTARVVITVLIVTLVLGFGLVAATRINIGGYLNMKCGDGFCVSGENAQNCPDDCFEPSVNLSYYHIMVDPTEVGDTIYNMTHVTWYLNNPLNAYSGEDCGDCSSCQLCSDVQDYIDSNNCADCMECDNYTGQCMFCDSCQNSISDNAHDTINYDNCSTCLECYNCTVPPNDTFADTCNKCSTCESCDNTLNSCQSCSECAEEGDAWNCRQCSNCPGTGDNCDGCSQCDNNTLACTKCDTCGNVTVYGSKAETKCLYCSYDYSSSGGGYTGCSNCYKTGEEDYASEFNLCGQCDSCAGCLTTEPAICERIKDCIKNYANEPCTIDEDIGVWQAGQYQILDNITAMVKKCQSEGLLRDLPDGGSLFICNFDQPTSVPQQNDTGVDKSTVYLDCGTSTTSMDANPTLHYNFYTMQSSPPGWHFKLMLGGLDFDVGGSHQCKYNLYVCGQPAVATSEDNKSIDVYEKIAFGFNESDYTGATYYVNNPELKWAEYTVNVGSGSYSGSAIADAVIAGFRDWDVIWRQSPGFLNSTKYLMCSMYNQGGKLSNESCANMTYVRIDGDSAWNEKDTAGYTAALETWGIVAADRGPQCGVHKANCGGSGGLGASGACAESGATYDKVWTYANQLGLGDMCRQCNYNLYCGKDEICGYSYDGPDCWYAAYIGCGTGACTGYYDDCFYNYPEADRGHGECCKGDHPFYDGASCYKIKSVSYEAGTYTGNVRIRIKGLLTATTDSIRLTPVVEIFRSPPDTTPPEITIDSPGSKLVAKTNDGDYKFLLKVSVKDNVAIDKSSVKYKIDSGSWGSMTADKCSGSCDTTASAVCICRMSGLSVTDGTHTLSVNVSDTSGNTTMASLTMTAADGPGSSNVGQNDTELNKTLNEAALFYAYWTDLATMTEAHLQYHGTTSADFSTAATITDGSFKGQTAAWSNFTISSGSMTEDSYTWRIVANDSAGVAKATNEGTFKVVTTSGTVTPVVGPQYSNFDVNDTELDTDASESVLISAYWTASTGTLDNASAEESTDPVGTFYSVGWVDSSFKGKTSAWSNFTFTVAPGYPTGAHYVRITAKDSNGKETATTVKLITLT